MTMTLSGSGTIGGLVAGGLPDATIVQADLASGISGTGPAFSAWNSATQSISSNVWTKATFDTEDFDTNSNFASSRFTPTVAGYYQISCSLDCGSSGSMTKAVSAIFKNGGIWKALTGPWSVASSTTEFQCGGSAIVYLNGSTDYVEAYAIIAATSPVIGGAGSGQWSWFQGVLVRAA